MAIKQQNFLEVAQKIIQTLKIMKFKQIVPLFLVFSSVSAVVLASPAKATPATSPFNIAVMAQRGQLTGIPGYTKLHSDIFSSGKLKVEAVIRAAGVEPTPELVRDVRSFIHQMEMD